MTMRKIRIKLKEDLLEYLQENWPGKPSKEIKDTFQKLKEVLEEKDAKIESLSKETEPLISGAAEPCNAVNIVQQTCASLDLLFLGKRITYHIAADSELSPIFAAADEVQAVLTELFRRIVKRMPHGERIDVSLNEVSLRQGRGIEIMLKCLERDDAAKNLAGLLHELFGEGEQGPDSSLFACRSSIIKQGGQLTVDLPKPKQPVFRVVLPTVGTLSLASSDQYTYKYIITIKNIANIRKRFGITKSYGFVSQIENYVRSLVRHPIDIVMSDPDKGIITAIYDTTKGAAQSVSSRISERMGKEEFKIGKKVVDVQFKYRLSSLSSAKIKPSK
ncbi:MAG: hypothetical protein ABH859_01015 [Pseudomonadota bacterium]